MKLIFGRPYRILFPTGNRISDIQFTPASISGKEDFVEIEENGKLDIDFKLKFKNNYLNFNLKDYPFKIIEAD